MLIGDSAFPPATYPTEFDGKPLEGWCAYIPGGDAYHGWSQAEIEGLKSQPWCRYIVPVFVRSNPRGAVQGAADAATVVAWSRAQGQPRGTLVMWDAETAVDSAYELAFDAALRAEDGDLEIAYGSKSTVIRMPAPSGGDDVADWTGTIPGSLASMAVQFYSADAYDLNDFRDGAPLWDLRPGPAAPTPAPTAHSLEENDMRTTSVNGRAGLAWAAGQCHVIEANYGAADQPDLELDIELKLTTGPLYVGPVGAWIIGHQTGTSTYEIPAEHIAACRGVILTVKSGPKDVVYDVCAV
jgi:hypothetical protein